MTKRTKTRPCAFSALTQPRYSRTTPRVGRLPSHRHLTVRELVVSPARAQLVSLPHLPLSRPQSGEVFEQHDIMELNQLLRDALEHAFRNNGQVCCPGRLLLACAHMSLACVRLRLGPACMRALLHRLARIVAHFFPRFRSHARVGTAETRRGAQLECAKFAERLYRGRWRDEIVCGECHQARGRVEDFFDISVPVCARPRRLCEEGEKGEGRGGRRCLQAPEWVFKHRLRS